MTCFPQFISVTSCSGTTLRDTCENYGLGGAGARSCTHACNASELQLLPEFLSTSSTVFNQTIPFTAHQNWVICDDGFPWPASSLCAYNSMGTKFHIGSGAVGTRIPGWPLPSCSFHTNITEMGSSVGIILKPGVVYEISAVAFNSHRVNRYTSPIFSRPSIIDNSAPDAKFTMYSSVSLSPVIFQIYMTSPAPTLWRPRLGYIFDVVQMGTAFDDNPSLQSLFFWDQGCDGYQSTIPALLQTQQTADASYYLDALTGYLFSMFVFNNGMPLINKTALANGLLYVNFSIPYSGQDLLLSSDFRYSVRVYTGNASHKQTHDLINQKLWSIHPLSKLKIDSIHSECPRSFAPSGSLCFCCIEHPTYRVVHRWKHHRDDVRVRTRCSLLREQYAYQN